MSFGEYLFALHWLLMPFGPLILFALFSIPIILFGFAINIVIGWFKKR
jgi:hypothetical protein